MRDEETTIGLKTFLRPDKLRTCLQHISELEPRPETVIVADDSPRKDLNREVYASFEDDLPLEVLDLTPDLGLSAGRNRIVDATETPYLMIIDDDHYLPRETLSMKAVLENEPSLGGISAAWVEHGRVKMIAGDIRIIDGWVVIDVFETKRPQRTAGFDCFTYDFVPNSTLFRTAALRDYPWDERYVIDGEHEDFFLGHKLQTGWEFAITRDIHIEHDPGPGLIAEYSDHRLGEHKRSESRDYFVEKWDVNGYLFRGYHRKEHANSVTELASRVMFAFPPCVQWELKRRGYLDRAKHFLERMTGAILG
jgi:GT2 family glycosyltransferase